MSRHIYRTTYQSVPVTVLAGFDRQLQEFFLSVTEGLHIPGPSCQTQHCGCQASVSYDSMYEPKLDWQDINTLLERLVELDVKLPQSLIEALYFDQCFNSGNRHMEHFMDAAPQHLPT